MIRQWFDLSDSVVIYSHMLQRLCDASHATGIHGSWERSRDRGAGAFSFIRVTAHVTGDATKLRLARPSAAPRLAM